MALLLVSCWNCFISAILGSSMYCCVLWFTMPFQEHLFALGQHKCSRLIGDFPALFLIPTSSRSNSSSFGEWNSETEVFSVCAHCFMPLLMCFLNIQNLHGYRNPMFPWIYIVLLVWLPLYLTNYLRPRCKNLKLWNH